MLSTVKVTTLCENSVPFPGRGLLGEHGLSMLLEAGGQRILFDTGAGLTLLQNSRTLKVDLTELDAVVLSHGHHDHTGGLKALLDESGPLPVYAHPDIFGDKYHLRKGQEPRQIGIPWSREELESAGAQFILARTPQKLGDGIILTGEVPRGESREQDTTAELCYKNLQGEFERDPLADDQSIAIKTPGGTIVLLGCAHSGLINTLQYVTELTGTAQIFACIGGTHLVDVTEERLAFTLKELEKFNLQQIAPCHCTGLKASFALYQEVEDRFLHNTVGAVFSYTF